MEGDKRKTLWMPPAALGRENRAMQKRHPFSFLSIMALITKEKKTGKEIEKKKKIKPPAPAYQVYWDGLDWIGFSPCNLLAIKHQIRLLILQPLIALQFPWVEIAHAIVVEFAPASPRGVSN